MARYLCWPLNETRLWQGMTGWTAPASRAALPMTMVVGGMTCRLQELALEYAQEALLELKEVRVLSAKAQRREESLFLELELCCQGEVEERFRLEWELNG